MLFSATLDGDVDVLIKRYQRNPERFEVVPDAAHLDRTTHHFLHAKREDRVSMTVDLVAKHGSTLVFCRTKRGADRVAGQLQRGGVSAVPIHGGRSQSQRDRALASFAKGRVQALVATDVAARGIHVDNVGCVVHFDIAGDHKDYLHRSGRTGRAGAAGVVISFVTEDDVAKARQLQKSLAIPGDATGRRSTPAPPPRAASRGSRFQRNRRAGSYAPRGGQSRRRSA
jgi:superfamily II DNA/RNA helicase